VTAPLAPEDLSALARLGTPALANAIETFGLRPNNEGFAGPEIRPLFPEFGTMVGYACTLRIAADRPRAPETPAAPLAYWEYIARSPSPRVMVVQDQDPHPVGAFWGEVNSNVHKGLGCIGAVTNGGVRDLDEMRRAGFHAFASAVLVSHANVYIIDFGTPVHIGRLSVRPGDLIAADQHGVLVVPGEVARDLPRVAAEIAGLEREIIDCSRAADFTPRRLADVWNSVLKRWPKSSPRSRSTLGAP
jgi:4-hydroxy-4-methyl-2-oxoglutarate aldolase